MAAKMNIQLCCALCCLMCLGCNATTTQPPTPPPLSSTLSTTPAATALPATPVARNTDLGPCPCDMTANACDVNCCCDSDCEAADRDAFSECVDNRTRPYDQTCVREDIMFRQNSPYQVNTTVPGLFCIQVDNYQQRNYYNVPEVADTPEKVQEYRDRYGGPSYQPTGRGFTVESPIYRSGDPLYTVFSNQGVGVLGLPRALTSRKCVDNNPAAFLHAQDFECTRELPSISESCEVDPVLRASTYYEYFQVIRTPVILIPAPGNDTETTTVPATTVVTTSGPNVTVTVTPAPEVPSGGLYNSSYTVPVVVQEVYCRMNGVNSSCNFTRDAIPRPTYSTQDGCQNIIEKVHYVVHHNGSGLVTAVGVIFTFATLTVSSTSFSQSFSSNFIKEGETNQTSRSGNPGYVVGEPIVAGTVNQTQTVDGNTIQVIQLGGNRNQWLTMVTSSPLGQCETEPDNRVSVRFGENMRSGCNIRVTYQNISQACQLIQEMADKALRGNMPTHVATFGNSDVNIVGDWVQILPDTERQPPRSEDGGCENLVMGLHIEIIYANVGSLGNPQPKIIGVKLRDEPRQTLKFQCVGPYCQPDNQEVTQTFEVVSSVGFVDATEPAVGVTAAHPRFTARLPSDFFYPFV